MSPRKRRQGEEAEDFLPLPRDTFDVLVSLADRDRHGYAIMQDIADRTGGRVRLSPSTLYRVVSRLLESGLIEEVVERPDPAHDDERRRYYRLTPNGRAVARAEARRLERLLADARVTGLLPRRG
jgi:DNA-binding PadR family transcriptional regulator